ncbi:Variable major protein (plasmid) [Borrelia coriaceae ATCC 43381]|uniref:Variable major protein n=1 Tax=Borrelia coriaceae ATCC 43381 TaxID=1408429 RepID=W5T206_9SPIR|nr:Variable major protein [Borrelia coriaceae ATCC 43381]
MKIRIKTICATFISLFLLLSCTGQLEAERMAAESKNTFFESLINIGHGFQEIFGSFGNAIGDFFGFTAVKSADNRSVIGEHFKKLEGGTYNN